MRAKSPELDDALRKFERALSDRGLCIKRGEKLIADGQIHRCDVAEKGPSGRDDGSYCLFLNDGSWPAGWFVNWTDGQDAETCYRDESTKRATLTAGEKDALERAIKAARTEREKLAAEARAKAVETWKGAEDAPPRHRYAKRKGLTPEGLRMISFEDGDTLLVPLRDRDGKMQSLQFIREDGTKRFLKSSRVAGCHYWVAKPNEAKDGNTICVCEGWATGESVFQATGYAVVIAFTAKNLAAVAEWVRKEHPDARIILCADDDWKTEGNPGLTKAHEAARVVNGLVAVPDFGPDRREDEKDFNDLHLALGRKAVARCIDKAREPDPLADDDTEDDEQPAKHKAKQADILIDSLRRPSFFIAMTAWGTRISR